MNRLQLDRSEQIGVVLCSIAVIALIFLGLYVYSGPRRQYQRARTELSGVVDQLGTMKALKASEEDRLEHQKKLMDLLKARPADFSLFAFTDKVIADLGLRTHATASNVMRGRGEAKDASLETTSLSLKGVGLKQILDVLHTLYASNNLIVVQRMDRLAPSQGGQGLDCELVLATLKTQAIS